MLTTKSPLKRFFDQSYNRKSQQLSLFIQASREQAYFAFFDSLQKTFVGFEEWSFDSKSNWHQLSEELAAILGQEEYRQGFGSSSFSLISPIYTLVPSPLFNENELLSYLSLNHSLDELSGFSYHSYEVPTLDTHIVYALPDVLKHRLEGQLKNVSFLHYTAPLLEEFSLQKSNGNELHLNINSECFDILFSKDGKLQLLNSFTYHNVEDFIYYLLYVMEQLEINRDHIELKVFGEIEEHSALYDIIFKYIRHPQLLSRTKAVNYSQPLSVIPPHQYRNVFSQYLCG